MHLIHTNQQPVYMSTFPLIIFRKMSNIFPTIVDNNISNVS